MKYANTLLVVAISTLLLTALFYKQSFGLNLLLFDIAFIGWLVASKQLKLIHKNEIIAVLGFLATAFVTVLTHSMFSYFIHFMTLFVLIGVLNYVKVKSLVNAVGISITSLFVSQGEFLSNLSTSTIKGKRAGRVLYASRIFIIPVVIIFVFIGIYSFSNPVFGDMVGSTGEVIQNGVVFLFEDLDFILVLTLGFSLLISNFLLFRTSNKALEQQDALASEKLVRVRSRISRYFKFNGLKNEYKAGLFLLAILNIMLLVLNGMDIYWVWFGFEWTGQYLKEFVHEGTYLLILSILISIVIVLYFFRGNLNFYTKNKVLKILSYVWLLQNGLLAISVAIRNFRYIEYFSLAYKRIGVVIFLLLVLYGLYTVFRKIQQRKSAFYLFKSNALVLYVVLVLTAVVNWDNFIARYNFNHANESFLHLDYLSTLSDKSLPLLDRPLSELNELDEIQKAQFPFKGDFMTPEAYHNHIESRKKEFQKDWESKTWLSWNLPEYLAYRRFLK